MDDVEPELTYNCPYCGEHLSLMVDPSGGASQSFTIDARFVVIRSPSILNWEMRG